MINSLEEFSYEYRKLSDSEQEKFALLVNKLINVNYITGEKEEDSASYYFIATHFNCFKHYLNLVGMELSLYKESKILVLESSNAIKLSLNKMQSALLLILRLLYHQKLSDITLSTKIIVTMQEIRDKYEQLNIIDDDKLNNTKLIESMRIFKRYNLINYKGQDFQQDDFPITIYKTIQYAVNIDTISELTTKLESYKNDLNEKGDENEELNEN